MKNETSTNKVLVAIVVIVLVISGLVFMKPKTQPVVTKETKAETNIFNCKAEKTISAVFNNQEANSSVSLKLSDGRELVLPTAISASGARYANKEETIVFWNKGDTATLEENGKVTYDECVVKSDKETSAISNPASENCVNVGGKLVISKMSNGGEFGICNFDDGKACEEWALMRGDCPTGGVKLTGFDTDAQKYCVLTGGETTATANAVCKFKGGSSCPVDKYFSGDCQKK